MAFVKYINKKLNRYFSEVFDIPQVQKINLNKFPFKIFLGGKNVGKSFKCFEELKKQLRCGNRCVYLRNSQEEIKTIYKQIYEMVKNVFPYDNLGCSQQEIYNKDTNKTLIKFYSIEDYYKVSGNVEGYDFVFYDEYNQNLTPLKLAKIEDYFFVFMSTIFRNKPWNVWVAGNLVQQQNLFYNLFCVSMQVDEDKLCLFGRKNEFIFFIFSTKIFKTLNNTQYFLLDKYSTNTSKIIEKGSDFIDSNCFVSSALKPTFINDELTNHDFPILINFLESSPTDLKIYYNNTIWNINECDNCWFVYRDPNKYDLIGVQQLAETNEIYCLDQDNLNEIAGVYEFNVICETIFDKIKNRSIYFDCVSLYEKIRQQRAYLKSFFSAINV